MELLKRILNAAQNTFIVQDHACGHEGLQTKRNLHFLTGHFHVPAIKEDGKCLT